MAYRSGSTGLRRTPWGGHESPGTLIGWAWLAPVASLCDGSHLLASLMPLPLLGKNGAQWVPPSSPLSFSSGRVLRQDCGDPSACSCRCSALHRERHFPCIFLLDRYFLSQPPSVLSSCSSWCCLVTVLWNGFVIFGSRGCSNETGLLVSWRLLASWSLALS